MKNLKTNLAGLAVLVILGLYFFNVIDTEQFLTGTAFLVSLGFFASKDHNVSGIGLPKPKINALDDDEIGIPKPKGKG